MISRDEIVGHRIANILAEESELGDIQFSEFVYVMDNSCGFRMPTGNPFFGEILPPFEPGPNHAPITWTIQNGPSHRQRLWEATITDILVPLNTELREPDCGVISLSSGWYLVQCSHAPTGILPSVNLIEQLDDEPMVSIWEIQKTESFRHPSL